MLLAPGEVIGLVLFAVVVGTAVGVVAWLLKADLGGLSLCEAVYLRRHIAVWADILSNDECECSAPPGWEPPDHRREPHPAEHQQHCPHYLSAYMQAVLNDRMAPDPDAWPDAPAVCSDCERAIGTTWDCEECQAAALAAGGE